MPTLTWRLHLGKIFLGAVLLDQDGLCYISTKLSGDIELIERLKTTKFLNVRDLVKWMCLNLLPEGCWNDIVIKRCENSSVVSEEVYRGLE